MCKCEEMQCTYFCQKNTLKGKLLFTRRGTQAKNEIYSKLNLKRNNCIEVKSSNVICVAVLFLGGRRSILLQERRHGITEKPIRVLTSFISFNVILFLNLGIEGHVQSQQIFQGKSI